MNKKDKIVIGIAVITLVLSGLVAFKLFVPQTSQFGATGNQPVENYIPVIRYNGGFFTELPFRVGSNGGDVNELKSTTCNLEVAPALLPLTASTTLPFQCAVTGVASGDQVFVSLQNDGGSSAGKAGISLQYAKASTTAGYIEVGLDGGTVSTSSFPNATTSVQVLFIDN